MMMRSKLMFMMVVLGMGLVGDAMGEGVKKNVLFIVSDDLRASVLGVYGDKLCDTPNIDRLAKRSMVFDRAYCQATVCGPSRQSFMFSRYTGGGAGGRVSMAEHFKKAGWYSARVGKIYHMKVPGDIIAGTNGVDHAASWVERFNCKGLEAHSPGAYALLNKNIFTRELKGRQSTAMPHRAYVTVRTDGDGSDQPDYKAASKAIELLRAKKDEAFFLAVGFVRPHYPMVTPPEYFEKYPLEKISLPKKVKDDWDDIPIAARSRSHAMQNGLVKYPENQKRMWAGYYASVSFMDTQLGRVMDELDRLGLREKTVVVFTSDHGYSLGDHDFWLKNTLREEVTRVPLMISGVGIKQGRSDALVELVDMYPTLVDLAGLPVAKDVHGLSLKKVLMGEAEGVREAAYASQRGGQMLRTKRYAYITYGKRAEELYDMVADPGQFTNLVGKSAHEQTVKRFREMLKQKVPGM